MKEGINGRMSGWVGGWMGRLCVNTHFCQWYEFSFPLCGWFKDRLEEVSGQRGEDDPDSLLNWKHLCVPSASIFARTSSQMWLIPVSQETSPPHQNHTYNSTCLTSVRNLRPGDVGSPLAWSGGLTLPVVILDRGLCGLERGLGGAEWTGGGKPFTLLDLEFSFVRLRNMMVTVCSSSKVIKIWT